MASSKVFLNWSSGKDSSLSLHYLHQSKQYEVAALFTTLCRKNRRIGLHGISETLLDAQFESLKLPAHKCYLPEEPNMEQYNSLMRQALLNFQAEGINCAAYGDIFLEDLKAYREEQLKKVAMHGVFPLWGKDSKEILEDFIQQGFKAIVVSASAKFFTDKFLGTELDQDFISKLPKEVDPCGENGEFHTFCYDGPIFEQAVRFKKGKKVLRHYPNPDGEGDLGFHFLDLEVAE